MPEASPYAAAVVQLARLGDLVQSWPLICRLRQMHGPGRTALTVDEQLESLAGVMVGSGNVTTLPARRLLATCRSDNIREAWRAVSLLSRRFGGIAADRVINLNFHPPSAAVAEAIPARERLGARWCDTVSGKPSDPQLLELFQATTGLRRGVRHLSDIWLEYAGESSGEYPFHPIPLSGDLVDKGENLLRNSGIDPGVGPVAVIPGAGLKARCWPVEHFARLVAVLSKELPVVLVGSATETDLADEIKALSGANPSRVISLCGQTDPALLAGLLSLCRLVIGVDTGPLHLGAAVGSRCLGIYSGSMSHRETGPYGTGHIVVTPDDPNYPCQEYEMMHPRGRMGMEIPPQLVIDAASSLIHDSQPSADTRTRLYRSQLGPDGLTWQPLEKRQNIDTELVVARSLLSQGQVHRARRKCAINTTTSIEPENE